MTKKIMRVADTPRTSKRDQAVSLAKSALQNIARGTPDRAVWRLAKAARLLAEDIDDPDLLAEARKQLEADTPASDEGDA